MGADRIDLAQVTFGFGHFGAAFARAEEEPIHSAGGFAG